MFAALLDGRCVMPRAGHRHRLEYTARVLRAYLLIASCLCACRTEMALHPLPATEDPGERVPPAVSKRIERACNSAYAAFEAMTAERAVMGAGDLRIDAIGRKFSKHAPAAGVWHFGLYPSTTPLAAWSEPLGVYVSDGVLSRVSGDAELAAVIAHAVAHAGYGSHTGSWQWFTVGCRAKGALEANASGEWHEQTADELRAGGLVERANESLLTTLRMPSEHAEEMTADRIALQLLADEGYDLEVYPRVMARLDEDAGWLAMHPDSDDRREALAIGMRKTSAH